MCHCRDLSCTWLKRASASNDIVISYAHTNVPLHISADTMHRGAARTSLHSTRHTAVNARPGDATQRRGANPHAMRDSLRDAWRSLSEQVKVRHGGTAA
jgi:hypothetical protein